MMRRSKVKIALSAITLLAAAAGAFVWLALHWTYSDGQRAGYVQALSRTGWACKTWEGQMNLITAPGTRAEQFRFTVRDPELAAGLMALSGRPVALHYQQHKGVPGSCFGESEYFVVGARPLT
jgi:hypothetical protein